MVSAQLSLKAKYQRSRRRLEVLERLANDSNLSPERRRVARALARSQRVAVDLGFKALAYAARQKLH